MSSCSSKRTFSSSSRKARMVSFKSFISSSQLTDVYPRTWRHQDTKAQKKPAIRNSGLPAFFVSLCLGVFYLTPANSWSNRQFSNLSWFDANSVADGLPSLSKCLENRPSERAKATKSTGSPVLGLTYQSSLT